MTTIQVKRGTEANRSSITPALGEPLVTTDNKELWIGDGSTPGGIPVGTVKTTETITQGQVAVFKDASGKTLKGKAEADIIAGLEKTTDVDVKLNNKLDKTAKAADADHADNADALGSRPASEYLTDDNITQSYQEDDANKVTSAAGVKALTDWFKSKVSSGTSAPSGGSHGDLYVRF